MSLAGNAYITVNADMAPFGRQTEAAVARFQKQMEGTWSTVGQRLTTAGSRMSAVGGKLERNVTLPLFGLAAAATKASADFGFSMEQVHTQAGAPQREVDRLRGKVLDLAKAMPQGPNELAKGLFHLESVGLRGSKAMDALKISAEGAAVGHANLEAVATALGSAWLVNIKGAGSLHHVMGLLNATVGAGNMRFEDLVQALGTGVLPASKEAGLSIRDVMGALAVFTDEGYNASSAAAQFSTALHFLYNPTSKASDAMKGIGLNANQLAIDMHKPNGLLVALTDLKSHLEAGGRSAVAQEQILGQILPGGRGRILLTLINQLDRYKMKLDAIQKGTGNFAEDFAKTQQTSSYKIDQAWSKIQRDAVQVGDKVGPPLIKIGRELADSIGHVTDDFAKLPAGAQDTILKGGLVLAGLGPGLKLLGLFTGGVGRLYNIALMAGKLAAGGGLLGKARGAGGVAGAGRTVTQTVGTMEVGTLITRSLVGGGMPPVAGGSVPVAGGRSVRVGQQPVQAFNPVFFDKNGNPQAPMIGRNAGSPFFDRFGNPQGAKIPPPPPPAPGFATAWQVYGRTAGAKFTQGLKSAMRAGGRSAMFTLPIAAIAGGQAIGGADGKILTGVGGGAATGALFGGPIGALVGGAAGLALSAGGADAQRRKSSTAGYLQGLTPEINRLVASGNVAGLRQLDAGLAKAGKNGVNLAQALGDGGKKLGLLDFKKLKLDPKQLAAGRRELQQTAAAIAGMQDAFSRLRHGSDTSFGQLSADIKRAMTGVATDLARAPAKGAKDAVTAFELIRSNAKTMFHDGEISSGQYHQIITGNFRSLRDTSTAMFHSIASTMGVQTKAGNRASIDAMNNYVAGIKTLMAKHVLTVQQGFQLIDNAFNVQAKAYHVSAVDAKAITSATILGHARARGGFIGKAGERGRDEVLLNVPEGSGIFTAHQLAPLFASGGTVPVLAGRGEYYAPPEEMPAFDRMARAAGFGGVKGLFSKVTRPHYAETGGIQRFATGGIARMIAEANQIDAHHYPYKWGGGHGQIGAGPYDCSGAVSAVLWAAGLLKAPMVASQFKSFGQPGPGPVTIYASDGHVYMSIDGKYFGTSGANPGGGAGWFPGGPRQGFVERHINAAGGSIPIPKIGGPNSLMKAISQGAITGVGHAANKRLNDAIASFGQTGGGDIGDSGAGGAQPHGRWDSLVRQVGLPPIFDWIIDAESSGNPRSVNSIGATGLTQILKSAHPDLARRFNLLDPLQNLEAAKILYDQSGLGPWAASRPVWGQHLSSGASSLGSRTPGHARGGIVGRLLHAASGLAPHAISGRPQKHTRGPKLTKIPIQKRLTAPFDIKNITGFDPATLTARLDKDLGRLTNQENLLTSMEGLTLPDGTAKTLLDQGDLALLAATVPPQFQSGEKLTDAEIANQNVALKVMVDKVATLRTALGTIDAAAAERERRKKLVEAFLKQQYGRYQRLTKDLADLKSSDVHRRLAAAIDGGRRSTRVNDARGSIAHYQGLISDERAKGKHADKGQIAAWEGKIREENAFIRSQSAPTGGRITSAQVAVARDNINRELTPIKADLLQFGGSATKIGTGGTLNTLAGELTSLYGDKGGLSDAVDALLQSDIPSIKLNIAKLGAPVPSTTTAAADTTRADLLQQLLDQAHLAYSVSQAQYKVLQEFPPFGGKFATGGVVPGPPGAARTIIAHGGETVTPAGDGGSIGDVHLHFAPGTEWLRDFVEVTVDQKNRGIVRHAGRALPSRGGGITR